MLIESHGGDYTIRKILGQILHKGLGTYLHVTQIISRRLKIAPSLEILILLSDRFHLSAVWLSVARRPAYSPRQPKCSLWTPDWTSHQTIGNADHPRHLGKGNHIDMSIT
jgi:hypothetical protein